MTWSYSGDPSESDLNEVRFLVGDTDSTDQLLTDEEIEWALTEESNTILVAAKLARALAAKYSRKVDKSVGDLKISYSQLSKQFSSLADDLEDKGGIASGLPYLGGISKDDKDNIREDDDRVRPAFSRDMQEAQNYDNAENELLSGD